MRKLFLLFFAPTLVWASSMQNPTPPGGNVYNVQTNNPAGTFAGSDLYQFNGTSVTFSAPGPLGVNYAITAGSMTGAGLSTCGDSSHALSWSSTNNLFSCQAITGSASPGGVEANVQYNHASAIAGATNFNVFPSSIVVGSAYTTYTSTLSVSGGSMTVAGIGQLTLSSATLSLGGAFFSTSTKKSSNYTVVAGDPDVILASAPITGGFQITLPSAISVSGKYVTITKTDTSSNTVTIVTTTPDLISASTGTLFLDAPGQSVRLTANATSWWTLGDIPYRKPYYATGQPISSIGVGTSSSTIYAPLEINQFVCLSSASVFIVTQGPVNARAQIGIYTSTGTTLANMGLSLVVRTSTIQWSAANVTVGGAMNRVRGDTLITYSPCFSPGSYWAGVSLDNTTTAISAASASINLPGDFRKNVATTGFTLPDNVAGLALNSAGNGAPYVVFYPSDSTIPSQ